MRRSIRSVAPCVVLAFALSACGTPTGGPWFANQALAGWQGVALGPVDPFAFALDPPEGFEDLPFSVVSAPFMGFVSGIFMGAFRIGMGVLDLAFSPLYVFPVLSPEPSNPFFEELEYEY